MHRPSWEPYMLELNSLIKHIVNAVSWFVCENHANDQENVQSKFKFTPVKVDRARLIKIVPSISIFTILSTLTIQRQFNLGFIIREVCG